MAITFSDAFTDSDGTGLDAHTPDTDTSGSGWTENNGNWEINSNEAEATGSSPGGAGWVATFDGGDADGDAEVVVSGIANNTSTQGLVFRYSDNDNFWAVFVRRDNGGSGDHVRLFKRESGSYSVIGGWSGSQSSYTISVNTNGNSIDVSIDGTSRITTTDSFNASETRYGIRQGTSGNCVFDDFEFDDSSVASSITITSPVRYFTNQRSGSTGSLTITVNYTGAPTALEADFNGGGYSTFDAAPTGGTSTGTITGQAEGQGTLTVRFANDTGVNDTVADIGIGDVFLVAGQSNPNRLTNNQSYSHASLKGTMFREDDAWAELADPTESGSSTGSIWPLLATEIMADQSVPVAFITTAEGGTRLVFSPAGWAEGNTNYNNAVQQVTDSGVDGIAAVLWYQGEGDSFGGISQSAYNTGLDSLITALRGEGGALANTVLICYQLGQYTTASPATNNNEIRAAQAEAWDDNANIHAGPVTFDQSHPDGVHWSTDAGGLLLARRSWFCVDEGIYDGTKARGPKIESATYDANVITVKFDQTLKTGLTFGLGAWAVDDNGSPATISAIDYATATDSLEITLSTGTPVGPVSITLGNANDAAGLVVPTGLDQTIASAAVDINLPAEPFYSVSVGAVLPVNSAECASQASQPEFQVAIPVNSAECESQGSQPAFELVLPLISSECQSQGSQPNFSGALPVNSAECAVQASQASFELILPTNSSECTSEGSQPAFITILPVNSAECVSQGSRPVFASVGSRNRPNLFPDGLFLGS